MISALSCRSPLHPPVGGTAHGAKYGGLMVAKLITIVLR